MKNFIFLLALGTILTCCKSAKDLALEGKYDKAISKAFDVLKKHPNNSENLAILKISFKNANNNNFERINQLQLKGAPDRWNEIADLYLALQARQDKVKQILPFLPITVQDSIPISDFDSQLIDAQSKAADYNYDRGMELLKTNNKLQARDAVKFFKQAKKYDPSDPEIDRMINEAIFLGSNHVLYIVNNYTRSSLPSSFTTRMSQVANSYINSTWVKYYTIREYNFNYDYIVELNLEAIEALPERINSQSTTYSKIIDDGWEYEYDRNGNIKKDTDGNDIKRKKTKQISCVVTETTQTKSIIIYAHLNYFYSKANKTVNSIPVSLEQPFYYQYVTYKGDKNALDNLKIKNDRPAPFPTTTDLIIMAQDEMANIVYNALKNNERLIRNSY